MIKWLFKWMFRLVFLLVILLAVLILSLDSIVRSALEQRIRTQTGMDARIGRLSVGLLSPELTAENIRVYNPAEFGGTTFLDIPEVHIEYDRFALLRRKLHITLLRFNLAEMDVVKNDRGRMNTAARPESTAKRRGRFFDVQFAGIDVLNLSVGRIRFVDLKNPQQTYERVLGIKDQIHRHVKTTGDLQGILFILWLQNGGGPFSATETNLNPSWLSAWL